MFLTQRFGGHSHSYNGFFKNGFFGGDGVISKKMILGGVICKNSLCISTSIQEIIVSIRGMEYKEYHVIYNVWDGVDEIATHKKERQVNIHL
ncbi:hypothetical protein GCM10020331_010130 [Ectobacillus funiculus]